MRLRNTLNDCEYEAELTTASSASSYGQAVLVDLSTGEAVDALSMLGTVLVEATDQERQALADAGYHPVSRSRGPEA